MLKGLSKKELVKLESGLDGNALAFLEENDIDIINAVAKFIKERPNTLLSFASMTLDEAINKLNLDHAINWLRNYPKAEVWLDNRVIVDYSLTKANMLRDADSYELFVFIKESESAVPMDLAGQLEKLCSKT